MNTEPEALDAELLPPPPSFPQAGLDKTPSPEQIAAGNHGNGSWNLNDTSVQQAWQEVHQHKRELADERTRHFHEKSKDALTSAVDLHSRIIEHGRAVMDKLEAGEKVSNAELNILAKAQASANKLISESTGKADATETKSAMMFLIGGD